jgi:RNA polymerase sigma-B factor
MSRPSLRRSPTPSQPDRDTAELGPSQLHTRNRSWLKAMAASSDAATKLWWRNALVEHNLALVRMVAQRQSQRSGQPFDELVSAGGLGLIRAVEAFDLRQTCNFSSFAVPYIRGAMLHDVRDHGQPLHTPRRLRELQQRARRLQEQRRGEGLTLLPTAALAEALGCRPGQLEEAAAVQRALQVVSLDAPLGGDGGEESGCLLDQLTAPAPDRDITNGNGALTAIGPTGSDLEATADATSGAADLHQERCSWLRAQLARLGTLEQRLLQGRWMEGLSWSELAKELQLSCYQAQRQGEALLAWLQEEAASTSGASASASKAAIAV